MIATTIFTKLQSRLDDIADQLADELDPVVEEAAQIVADKAKGRVPTETGRLQESIRPIKFDTCKYNVVADAVAPQAKTSLPYGIFVEYGTEAGGKGGGNAPAQPFMGPAAEDAQGEFEQMVNNKLREL